MTEKDLKSVPLLDEENEGGGEIIGNCIPIPPGRYEVRYMYYATGYYKDNPKVIVYCGVIEPEEYAGTPLERFYNVESLKGSPKKYGDFVAKARGDLNREISSLTGPIERLDRISPSRLRGKRIICEVETVTQDRDKRSLVPDLQYSCIRRFVKVLLDDNW